jgi:hypothetical protein
MKKKSKKTGKSPGGVQLQPMLHVKSMAAALRFFAALGGKAAYGSRDGDWSLVRFGNSELALLAHPPNTDQGDAEFELNFLSHAPLKSVEARARAARLKIFKRTTDEAFGRQLILQLDSGLLVKINEIEEDLVR